MQRASQRRAVSRGALVLAAAVAAALLLAQGGIPATRAALGAQSPDDRGQTLPVACDRGQTIAQALRASRPGATILISGTCRETVTITTDGVTLDGQGSAVVDGGSAGVVLTVDGARDVTLTGLTVRNGTRGIDVLRLATVAISDTHVHGSRSHGVEITNASVDVRNLTSRDNGRAGLIVNRSSLLNVTGSAFVGNLTGLVVYSNANSRLSGVNRMEGNATQGLTVGLGAVVFSLGSTVLTRDNGEEGVLLLQDGGLELIGGRLEASRNGRDGVRVEQLATLTVGITAFGARGTATTADNGGHGISVSGAANVSVSEIMPLASVGNGASGLSVDGGSTVVVGGSRIEGNGAADVALTFGALATLEDNDIGTITCDATVHARGTTTCP